MSPMASWALLLGVLALVTAGALALIGQMGRAEQAANEPLTRGWRPVDEDEGPTTVHVRRPPYDRTLEDEPI